MFDLFYTKAADLYRGPAAPEPYAQGVRCCLQMDGRPKPTEAQGRRGSISEVRVFFLADPGVAGRDVVLVDGVRYTAEAPSYDASGQAGGSFGVGAPWCVDAVRAN